MAATEIKRFRPEGEIKTSIYVPLSEHEAIRKLQIKLGVSFKDLTRLAYASLAREHGYSFPDIIVR